MNINASKNSSTKLFIVRHGNTFDKGDKILRVGLRTDLPLSNSGKEQAILLGKYIQENNLTFDVAFCSNLKRTFETADIALKTANIDLKITPNEIFDEIDYGEDEGKPEEVVVARLGKNVLSAWDKDAIVPSGWNINPGQITQNWKNFASNIIQAYPNKNILVVTSNGIARFAPHLTNSFDEFKENFNIKLSTGSISCLTYNISEKNNKKNWQVECWNIKPKEFVKVTS